MSVCESKYIPSDIIEYEEVEYRHNIIKSFVKKPKNNSNRQNYEKYVWNTGAIYIFNTKWFLRTNKIYDKHTLLYITDQLHSVDIDSQNDLDYASYLLEKNKICI
jgi:CMP-N-acetylneuraminic acid synthetase